MYLCVEFFFNIFFKHNPAHLNIKYLKKGTSHTQIRINILISQSSKKLSERRRK